MTQKLNKKIGLIGAGNMGSAIIEGALGQEIIQSGNVHVYDKKTDKACELAAAIGAKTFLEIDELVSKSDILLLAFKPQDLSDAAAQIAPHLKAKHIVISILAGVSKAKLKKVFGAKAQYIRVMPNLGASVGASISAICGDKKGMEAAEKLFIGCGEVVALPEKHFDLVTAMSGSGPAYFFLLMELIADYGIKQGLTKKVANLLAVQTALGAGVLAAASNYDPGQLRAMVTSKKGTTEAALNVLKSPSFKRTFHKALGAAKKRSQELNQ